MLGSVSTQTHCSACNRVVTGASCACADPEEWELVAGMPFVDVTRSRSDILRALYIPWLSSKVNVQGSYVLLQHKPQRPSGFLSSIF